MQGVTDGLRLLVDFLEHEMTITALANGLSGQLGQVHWAIYFLIVLVKNCRAGTGNHGPVAIFQIDNLLGQLG